MGAYMKTIKVVTWTILLSFCLIALGCGGGGADVRATNTTMGQELTDLQKAKEQGLITDDEFEDAKEKILDRD